MLRFTVSFLITLVVITVVTLILVAHANKANPDWEYICSVGNNRQQQGECLTQHGLR